MARRSRALPARDRIDHVTGAADEFGDITCLRKAALERDESLVTMDQYEIEEASNKIDDFRDTPGLGRRNDDVANR